MKPYVVLGTYKPTKWRAWRIGREICQITADASLVPHHSPPMLRILEKSSWKDYHLHANVVRFAHPEYEGSSWHQDGDHAPGADMDCRLVLWTNRNPTEIRYNNEIFVPKPWEIILFSNLQCFHRRPPGVSGKRWLFRQRVKGDE